MNFSKALEDEGLLPAAEPEVSSTASSSRPSNPQPMGCKPKAAPPLQLPSVNVAPPAAVAASMATPLATPSGGFAKGIPMPVEENYMKKKLVVNPYEMKKFLYGTQQSVQKEDHSWPNIKHIFIIYFNLIGMSILENFSI